MDLIKGKKLPEGTIREWSGQKFQKIGGKWKPVKDSGKSKNDAGKEDSSSKSLESVGKNVRDILADVGYTEEQLKEKKIEYKSGSFPMKALGRARASMDTQGLIKVLVDKKTDEILGVHTIGPRAYPSSKRYYR